MNFADFFTWENLSGYFRQTVFAVLILLFGYLLSRLIAAVVKRCLRKTKCEDLLSELIVKCVFAFLMTITIITALARLGVPTGGLITALAAVLAAIALSLKDSLGNISAGILLLITPRFARDDFILVEDYEGKVTRVGLMFTTILTYDNRQVLIPNSVLVNNIVVNLTREPLRRVDIRFPIPYGTDTEFARKLATSLMAEFPHAYIDDAHAPATEVLSYEDSSVMLFAKVWCRTEHFWETYYGVRERLLLGMAQEGIEIPFNRVDVMNVGQ